MTNVFVVFDMKKKTFETFSSLKEASQQANISALINESHVLVLKPCYQANLVNKVLECQRIS